MDRKTQAAMEQMDMLAAQALSLTVRADAFERVARELRTESAGVVLDLARVRQNLENDVLRHKIRRVYSRREVALSLRRRSA